MFVLMAGMLPAGMFLLMVVTMHVRIITQIAGQISADRFIRLSGYTAEELDPSLLESGLGAASDTAAD